MDGTGKMTLPPEKIAEMEQIIRAHLSKVDIQTYIKDLNQEASRDGQDGTLSKHDLLAALVDKGILNSIRSQLQFDSNATINGGQRTSSKPTVDFEDVEKMTRTPPERRLAAIDSSRRYLFIRVLGGRAFLEHIQEPDPLPGHVTSFLTLHVHFRGQRFKSRPTPCACEPNIQDSFLLELQKETEGEVSSMLSSTVLLSLADPIHLVVTKTEPTGDTTLISSHYLEWRQVLAAPGSRCTRTIELMGVGAENKVTVGILELRMELVPPPAAGVKDAVISAQMALQKNRNAERERCFLVYAKQWWKEYLQIRVAHRDRLVKIFAQDENLVNRPVPAFVKPLRAGRLLDTPRQAARFVSLIGYEKVATLGGGERGEQWTSRHAFLCRNRGDCEDHAILLCSLLLGFGLDTYMCVGTKQKGTPHAWVMTINLEGQVIFWESLTGHRYIHRPLNRDSPTIPPPKPAYPYRTIGCVFNNTCFYANSQPTDMVETCEFVLTDESKWKAMSGDAVQSVCGDPALGPDYPMQPPLCASIVNAALASNDLEQELRMLVTQHRRDRGLATSWDNNLSYLLTPALAAYEMERVTGITSGNEEFQQAIRQAVPDGHTFKGYPIQFVHRNGRRTFTICQKSPVFDEILNCRGDHVRLAVRVRVFTYPESACATWIMFACKYRSVL